MKCKFFKCQLCIVFALIGIYLPTSHISAAYAEDVNWTLVTRVLAQLRTPLPNVPRQSIPVAGMSACGGDDKYKCPPCARAVYDGSGGRQPAHIAIAAGPTVAMAHANDRLRPKSISLKAKAGVEGW
jgi:hypothetical protein